MDKLKEGSSTKEIIKYLKNIFIIDNTRTEICNAIGVDKNATIEEILKTLNACKDTIKDKLTNKDITISSGDTLLDLIEKIDSIDSARFYVQKDEPTKVKENDIWLDLNEHVFKVRESSDWKMIGAAYL